MTGIKRQCHLGIVCGKRSARDKRDSLSVLRPVWECPPWISQSTDALIGHWHQSDVTEDFRLCHDTFNLKIWRKREENGFDGYCETPALNLDADPCVSSTVLFSVVYIIWKMGIRCTLKIQNAATTASILSALAQHRHQLYRQGVSRASPFVGQQKKPSSYCLCWKGNFSVFK